MSNLYSNIIIKCFEGGSNYWIDNVTFVKLGKETETITEYMRFGEKKYKDGYMIIRTDNGTFHLTINKIKKGIILLKQLYPQHYTNFKNDILDEVVANIILQLSMFKKLIYGETLYEFVMCSYDEYYKQLKNKITPCILRNNSKNI